MFFNPPFSFLQSVWQTSLSSLSEVIIDLQSEKLVHRTSLAD